jgi:putative transposase
VVGVLRRITMERRTPKTIRVDNSPEFVSKLLDQWAYRNDVTLDLSRPGKPTENDYVESFNGSPRDECLNVNWFLSLEDTRGKTEAWRRHYNECRPHIALGDVSPSESGSKGGASPALAGPARHGIFTPSLNLKRRDFQKYPGSYIMTGPKTFYRSSWLQSHHECNHDSTFLIISDAISPKWTVVRSDFPQTMQIDYANLTQISDPAPRENMGHSMRSSSSTRRGPKPIT